MHGLEDRQRSIEKIVFYVEKIVELEGRDIRFITPDGLAYGLKHATRGVDLASIEELLHSIKKSLDKANGRIFLGSFPSEVRPEHVTEDSIKTLKKYVANKNIILGAQSGSPRILKAINRGHNIEDVFNAVEIITKYGFIPHVDLIIGFPSETIEDMWDTIHLAKKIVEYGGRIHLHYYLPLPGTPLGNRPPTQVPSEIKREFSKIIGSGRGYGDWIKQEELARRMADLYRKGIIISGNIVL